MGEQTMFNKILLIMLSTCLTSATLHAMQTTIAGQEKAKLQEQLLKAVAKNDIAGIHKTIAAGADINAYIAAPPCMLTTVLIKEVSNNNLDTVKILLNIPGIQVNAQQKLSDGSYRKTALYIATDLLLTSEIQNMGRNTPVLNNAVATAKKIIKLLLEHGADPEIPGSGGGNAITLLDPQYLPRKFDEALLRELKTMIVDGHAAYVKAKQRLLQESKTAASAAGERGLPGPLAGIIAEYAVSDEDVAEYMQKGTL